MTSAHRFARPRPAPRLSTIVLASLDIAVVFVATMVAYYIRFEGIIPDHFSRWILPLCLAASAIFLALFAAFGLYRMVLRYAGLDALLKISAATGLGTVALFTLNLLMPLQNDMRPVPIGVLLAQALLVFLGTSAVRLGTRVPMHLYATRKGDHRHVLIVGAGSAGPLVLREIESHPDLGLSVVGFLDDDRSLHGMTLSGVRVLGGTADLATMVEKLDVAEVIVAMPSAPRETVRAILNVAAEIGVETRVVPQIVTARGSVSLRDLRPVEVEDLLGREPTPIDVEQVRETLAGRTVAVTGAAGSIGSELCRQVAELGPKRLLLLDVDETRLYELWLQLETTAPGVSEMRICDVRDPLKIEAVFSADAPNVVLHAAAYKHVPLMELEPAEAIKTNVGGTRNVLRASALHGVERFVLISTDKAVAPSNMMGMSKRLAECVMSDAAHRLGLNAVAVRFGNVLASRGSVIPIFEGQLRRGGPLTVTDPEVTRYFMTIPEAARLVLQAQAIGDPGDIFVLEMGEPVKIATLAAKMIALSGLPADIVYTGLRPGERLHEVLIDESETLTPTGREKIMRVGSVHVPPETFAADIDGLLASAATGDIQRMRDTICRLEPGFPARGATQPKGSDA